MYLTIAIIIVIALGLLLLIPNSTSSIETTVSINAPVNEVFQSLLRIDEVDQWVDEVIESKYVSGLKETTGATRQCHLKDGNVVKEQITGIEKNKLISMEMVEHKLPVKYFKWDIITEEVDTDQTSITQQTAYLMKLGLIGKLMDLLMVRKSLEKTLKKAYGNLKTKLENDTV